AVERGVAVRLLVDDVGARYSWPSVIRMARRAGIPVAGFLPVLLPRLTAFANLRNHRKLLIVDGRIGFTGGINIREEHCLESKSKHAIQDLHFRLTGPVVSQLQDAFARDWFFTTHERLEGELWFPDIAPVGETLARGIADGPDEDFDILRNTILGAIASARSSIAIMTPYFLPDAAIIASLNVAAMRGIEVRIIIPHRTNLAFVQWASTAQLWQILQRGCRLWRSGEPFDHSKLMIVDEQWSFLGSANWDPRSLRLNFEFNVECYDKNLAQSLLAIFEIRLHASQECTLEDVDQRRLLIRVRDGFARTLAPYL
ncbi:MAG: phospholipase D-like domain-containing protein, partial [Planctomycetota bacterium]|nr:phospholipase D-like domain-containing protein [Planctomycetota bacterium]